MLYDSTAGTLIFPAVIHAVLRGQFHIILSVQTGSAYHSAIVFPYFFKVDHFKPSLIVIHGEKAAFIHVCANQRCKADP